MMESTVQPGSVIEERYKLEKLLGGGSHGAVWLAEDIHLKRQVAIKFIQSVLDKDGETVARLQREAKVLQRLDHPNILQVFRIGTINFETFFLAMEYIEGKPGRGARERRAVHRLCGGRRAPDCQCNVRSREARCHPSRSQAGKHSCRETDRRRSIRTCRRDFICHCL